LFLLLSSASRAEDGYRLWLRYEPIPATSELGRQYRAQLATWSVPFSSATAEIISQEIVKGVKGFFEKDIPEATLRPEENVLLAAPYEKLAPDLAAKIPAAELTELGESGYLLKTLQLDGRIVTLVTANTEIGVLYGTFHLLRLLQTRQPIDALNIREVPRTDLRILNHWDNLDRTVERGYAGFSIWDWHRLPGLIEPRYIDYARANASIGINGTVLTNVNANALTLTPLYLEKAAALADVFRPYGIKVYLTARFSAPIEIGGLETADPLDPAVRAWWAKKAAEIYEYIPDFGGFLVKANSEGQPGPQNYDRNHAEGANVLADALAPHGGIVMWRAFVYSNEEPEDRAKQAYNEFKPIDGKFRDNVLVQVKNGPIDFQPREPFHPLFGAMPATPLMMEFQITQEYLGQATTLCYLAPLYEEVLKADTYVAGAGSTVAEVIDGSLHDYPVTGMAGVANIGTDRNWTGHPFGQANWYAFGRLAWNPASSSATIADEWIRMTFSNDPLVVRQIRQIMLRSREAVVDYMTPLGLHHLMGWSHHYGPGPWVADKPRADWTSVYYHQADKEGIGFDRTSRGSDALRQYAAPIARRYEDPATTPDQLLLWFHHLPWDYELAPDTTLWEGLCYRYYAGAATVAEFQREWDQLAGKIDAERHQRVKQLLAIQYAEAVMWRDACVLYFQTFAQRPIPAGLERPQHDLEYYREQSFPYAPGIRPQW
jgi:alpha-glucuronidase